MPITVESPRGEAGVDSLYDTQEKVFEDIRANPGEKAFVFIHSVPFEGSVSLVNLLTSTRLVRKGFDVSIILYGPGVLLASRHRGYPTIGTEGFDTGHWVLLDFGEVVVHVFFTEVRAFYDLDGLWADAPKEKVA